MDTLGEFIEMPLFKKLIDEISEYPDTTLVLHRRGESLLHPHFIEMCNYIRGRFTKVQLATNATVLDEVRSNAIIETIHFISFSIDIPKVLEATRIPAKYDKIESNIKRFLALNKGRVKTQVSMVKTKDTPYENTGLFKELWSGKVDRIRIYEEHSENGKFGSLTRDRGKRSPCVMPFYEMLIYCDGKVGRCNHDWNGKPMGDANLFRIKDIWNNELYSDLRLQQKNLDITDDVCRYCQSWYKEIDNQGTGETIE